MLEDSIELSWLQSGNIGYDVTQADSLITVAGIVVITVDGIFKWYDVTQADSLITVASIVVITVNGFLNDMMWLKLTV